MGLVRIRHYGILSSTSKKVTIPEITRQPKRAPRQIKEPRKLVSYNPKTCPCCKTETMVTLEIIPKRGPPNQKIVPHQKSTVFQELQSSGLDRLWPITGITIPTQAKEEARSTMASH